jgi:hypothetical protein
MKPGTFTQMYVQLVFAVQNRDAVLSKEIRHRVFEYMICPGRFSWQEGYGGFTYSRSQINDVYNYILNQESHHSKCTFRDEYIDYLNKNEMEFDEQFLFAFLEDSV